MTLDSVLARAESLSAITGLLIAQRDSPLVERYYRGMTPERAVNVKSISKTLLSPLVGIAIRDSLIDGVGQPVAEILPEHFRDLDSTRRRITVGHLLTMTSGLESTSFDNYGRWVTSRHWVRHILRRPMECEPGACWGYSTGNSHLISAILTRVSGKSTLAYARDALFRPLGIPLAPWDRDPQGVYLGGNNMRLRPRDLLKIGQLYLDEGRYEGRQLVPPAWILASWRSYAVSPWNDNDYGYLWWSRSMAGERVHFAWGYGGQFLFVVPGAELVVVVTSSLEGQELGFLHTRGVHRLMESYVIPALARPAAEVSEVPPLPPGAGDRGEDSRTGVRSFPEPAPARRQARAHAPPGRRRGGRSPP